MLRTIIAISLLTFLLSCSDAQHTKSTGMYAKETLRNKTHKGLCAQEGYLKCLNVTREFCETELSQYIDECEAMAIEKVPEIEQGKKLEEYSSEFTSCLLLLQISRGNYNGGEVGECMQNVEIDESKFKY